MLRPVIRSAATLGILRWFIPGIQILNIVTLVLASVALSVAFGLIRPLLQAILLPINFVTFGLTNMLIAVGLLWLVQYLVPGFAILPITMLGIALNQFFTLVFVAGLISVVSSLLRWLI